MAKTVAQAHARIDELRDAHLESNKDAGAKIDELTQKVVALQSRCDAINEDIDRVKNAADPESAVGLSERFHEVENKVSDHTHRTHPADGKVGERIDALTNVVEGHIQESRNADSKLRDDQHTIKVTHNNLAEVVKRNEGLLNEHIHPVRRPWYRLRPRAPWWLRRAMRIGSTGAIGASTTAAVLYVGGLIASDFDLNWFLEVLE